jgi:hypothetical protein
MKYLLYGCICFCIISCKPNTKQASIDLAAFVHQTDHHHQSVKALTDVMVHDIFSPPVASRIYAYANIAAYEAGRHDNPSLKSLAGTIKHLSPVSMPDTSKAYCFSLASTMALLKVGKALIFSEDSITNQINKVKAYYASAGLSEDVMANSVAYGDTVAAHIIRWSSSDNYKQTRSFPKFSLEKDPSTWKPTPPGYNDAVEPAWNKIRPMLMDSASIYKPEPPTAFDVNNKKSQFYQEVMEVYNVSKTMTDEQKEIANFWDCNPFKLNITGHINHATKKISPGGHWINIVAQVTKQGKMNMPKTLETYALTSLALYDAFISCWDEKYRSKLIRPESVINEYIDKDWLPLLQTPPFPEYTSGHSVASAACATVLTKVIGDNFAYHDSTEVEFGLPVRSFTSFEQAASEASISRLYGGIHYRPAIENGIKQGRKVGEMVLKAIGK